MNGSIATIEDAVRSTQGNAAYANTPSSQFNKWIIIAAAVFGALMLMRRMCRVSKLLFGFFWIWFWTHGAWRHVF